MKKLLSVKYTGFSFNLSMLVLRATFGGILLFKHGLLKLQNFNQIQHNFYSFLGMGSATSLVLAIFAEVFCSLFIIIGLFTRFSVIPVIIMLLVVLFGAQAGKPFLDQELALLYLAVFFTLLLCGPGKISVDGMINR